MREEREALERAVARLEEVAARMARPDAPAEDLRALAEEALRLSGEISERLPQALRDAGETA